MRTFLNAARKAAKDETGAVNWFAVLAILVVALLVVLVLGQLGYIGPERSATVEIPEGAITVNVEVPTPEEPEVLCDLNGLCRQVGENTEDIEELMAPCDPLFADFEGELWLLAVDEDLVHELRDDRSAVYRVVDDGALRGGAFTRHGA